MTDKMREEFEAAVVALHAPADLLRKGEGYKNDQIQSAWWGWQAAGRDQAEQDYKDVVGTIELRDIEIAKLRAEIAGLKTGYEAYERVNAELKAEVAAEIQRRFDGNEISAREHYEEVSKLKAECEAMRKHQPSTEVIWCACGDGHAANSYGAGFMDANGGACQNCDAAQPMVSCPLELFETLRDSANTEADEHRQCMATYRPLRQANLDSVVKKCDDLLAAMGQGERS